MAARQASAPTCLNLALQGGGSHGAFTWGVLDALLEDGGFGFPGVSGTSAGAMNAAALVNGFASAALEFPDDAERRHTEGCARARESLKALWDGVGTMGSLMWGVPAAHQALMGMMTQWLSPYQTNPLDFNPLRSQLERVVDFAALQRAAGLKGVPQAFVCATNVRTGRGKIFKCAEITADAVMASACLPQMFRAVEIDGEHYWDGGYSGNPALYPLIYDTQCSDMLLVQINPIEHAELPNTAAEIMERMNEVTFNAGLLGELRAIDFVRRLLAEGRLDASRYKSVLLHRIDGGAALAEFGAASKMRADSSFLRKLFALGRAEGERWITAHRDDVGVRQTLQIVDNP
ncbi:patatin-like phospholipase family protein [Comamonas terrigena]|uniref:patatin-like phospholipase family protein n=1 Tax=Comamonas terrigena TaxID=32013 RepID=UPI0028B087D0|nr:patatin-like phospholipase family protein [Comamonas terrigena]